MTKRETSGNYELIFPFNDKSDKVAAELNRFAGQQSSMGASQPMKILIDEIRNYTEARMQYVKANYA
jgi:hypothetical protein